MSFPKCQEIYFYFLKGSDLHILHFRVKAKSDFINVFTVNCDLVGDKQKASIGFFLLNIVNGYKTNYVQCVNKKI